MDGKNEQAMRSFNLQRKSLPVYTFDEFRSETELLSRVPLFRLRVLSFRNNWNQKFVLFETKMTLSLFGQGQTA